MASAQPMTTVSDIDEALWWVTITAPRDAHYPRIIDSLLDQRSRIIAGLGPAPLPPSPTDTTSDDTPSRPSRHRRRL